MIVSKVKLPKKERHLPLWIGILDGRKTAVPMPMSTRRSLGHILDCRYSTIS